MLARRLAAGLKPGVGVGAGAGQPVRAAAAGRGAGGAADPGLGGAAARLGRVAAACAAGAAVQRRRRHADHPGRACFATAVLPFRHPGLVQRPGAHGAGRRACRPARGYLEEHRNNIRADRAGHGQRSGARRPVPARPIRSAFAEVLATQTTLRGLTEAVIYEPITGQVLAAAGLFAGHGRRAAAAGRRRSRRCTAMSWCSAAATAPRVRAVVQLDSTPPLMLMIGRPVDPQILDHMQRTETGGGGISAAGPEPLRAAGRLRAGSSPSSRCWCCSRPVLIGLVMANQIARPIGRLISAAERVRGGDLARARAGSGDRRRAGRAVARVQPHDRPAGRAAHRTDGRLQPDRRAAALHRDGAVRRLRRRDRPGRAGPHRAAEPRRRRIAGTWICWRAIGQHAGRGGAGIRRRCWRAGAASAGPAAHRRDADRARRTAAAPCWCASARELIGAGGTRRRSCVHLRRHHRIAVGPAQGGLGRCGAAHRARDQEPADPDPAFRRAAEAPLHQGDHAPIPRRSRNAPTPSSAMSAISGAWSTSSPPSRACRMPVIKPEDVGRIAREALVLQRTAQPGHRLDDRHSRARAGGAVRPAADRPGADQPAAECRRRGGDARRRGRMTARAASR